MADVGITEIAHLANPQLTELQKTSFEDFQARYSSKTNPPGYWEKSVHFFLTNEYEYPTTLDAISVRGGLHLAVTGGLDPVLGQLAVANPDLTILCEINPDAMRFMYTYRLSDLVDSQNGTEYWNKLTELYGNRGSDLRRLIGEGYYVSAFSQDMELYGGGWSSSKYFEKVKQAWIAGKIKGITADIVTEGIKVGKHLARQTSTPIKLIYVSNIFDYSANNFEAFKQELQEGLTEGTIDPKAQVVDSATYGMVPTVFNINDYLEITDETRLRLESPP